MPIILFNAFSSLQKKLKEKHIEYSNATMKVEQGSCATDLVRQFGLEPEDVGSVLINGRAVPFDKIIQDNDRVAFVPPVGPMLLIGVKPD